MSLAINETIIKTDDSPELKDKLYAFRDKIANSRLVKFWEKKDDVDTAKVKSYLFTTAYHKLIDVVRREKKQRNRGLV